MFPRSGNLCLRNGSLRHGTVAFRHDERPAVGRPADAAYVSQHVGVVYLLRQSALRGIEPVVVAVGEDGTVGDAHPAVAACKLIGMGHHRKGISSADHVFAQNVVVRSCDALGADDARIIGHIQGIVGEEEIVPAVVPDHFGTFRSLPAVAGSARVDGGAVAFGYLVVCPRKARFTLQLACGGIRQHALRWGRARWRGSTCCARSSR
ncbi:unknown [Bacteroides sp. CAG:462]|nr:unknown [Bacteroides sp. CAG:462]